jgi:hypothetical protein
MTDVFLDFVRVIGWRGWLALLVMGVIIMLAEAVMVYAAFVMAGKA